ncbi:hypothetical protein M0811_12713 [Anaeramoeba ignava]|uniref:Uncharacterized protein n=1 Tax=Anaeramoeba ignava TaxID=1746090 RepID=A0A9Q0L8F8_ANAIG|nr:hypothetical protein M0811_12713 [Anaeramoeba ignava]
MSQSDFNPHTALGSHRWQAFLLSLLFLFFGLISLSILFYQFITRKKYRYNETGVFYFATLILSTIFLLWEWIISFFTLPWSYDAIAYLFHHYIPLFLQFGMFSIFVLFILKIYYFIQNKQNKFKIFFRIYLLIVFLLFCIMYAVCVILDSYEGRSYQKTFNELSAILIGIFVIIFTIISIKIGIVLKDFGTVQHKTSRKIKIFSVFLFIYLSVFIFRMFWLIFDLSDANTLYDNMKNWENDGDSRYYTANLILRGFLELVPTIIIVTIFHFGVMKRKKISELLDSEKNSLVAPKVTIQSRHSNSSSLLCCGCCHKKSVWKESNNEFLDEDLF